MRAAIDSASASLLTPFDLDTWLVSGMSHLKSMGLVQYFEKVSWVYAAADKVASTVSQVPAQFYFKDTEDLLPPDHPVYIQFHPPWGANVPSMASLFYISVLRRELFGEMFWVFRNTDVIPTLPTQMFPLKNEQTQEILGWEWSLPNGGQRRLRLDDVLFYKYPHPTDPVRGMSRLAAARWSIEQDINMVAWNANNFKEGVAADMVISTKQGSAVLNPKARKEIRDSIKESVQGIAGKRVLAVGNADVETIASSLRDLEYSTGREMTREEICAVMDVPPALIGIYRYANFANARFQGQTFYFNKVRPITSELAEAVNLQMEARGMPEVELRFDLTEIINQFIPIKDRAEAAKILVDIGIPLQDALDEVNIGIEVDESSDPDGSGDGGTVPDADSPSTQMPVMPPMRNEDVPDTIKVDKEESPLRLSRWAWTLNEAKITPVVNKFMRVIAPGIMREIRRDEEFANFDSARWARSLESLLQTPATQIFYAGWNVLEAEIGKDGAPDVLKQSTLYDPPFIVSEDIVQQIRPVIREIARASARVTDSMARDLELRVSKAFLNGNTLDEVEAIVEDVLKSPAYVRNITRQVVGGAYNTGRQIAMQREGVIVSTWQSMGDGDVRDTHGLEHGNTVPLGDRFPVTGLRYPHDPSGPSSEIYGCRCIAVPGGQIRTSSDKLSQWFPRSTIAQSYMRSIRSSYVNQSVEGWRNVGLASTVFTASIGFEIVDRLSALFKETNDVDLTLSADLSTDIRDAGGDPVRVALNANKEISKFTPWPVDVTLTQSQSQDYEVSAGAISIPPAKVTEFSEVMTRGKYGPDKDPNDVLPTLVGNFGLLLEKRASGPLNEYREKSLEVNSLDANTAYGSEVASGPPVQDSRLPHRWMSIPQDDVTNLTRMFYYMLVKAIHDPKAHRIIGEWFLADTDLFQDIFRLLWEESAP